MPLPACDIHVCLISKELAPNFLPVRISESKPKKMVLLVSSSMQKNADKFVKILKKNNIETEILNIQSGSPEQVQSVLFEYLEKLSADEKAKIALNITGGTKLMAFAAQELFFANKLPVFYIDTQEKQIAFLEETKFSSEPLPQVLGYEDLLLLKGYETVKNKDRESPVTKEHRQFSEELIRNFKKLESSIGCLNMYATEAEYTNLIIQRKELEPRALPEVLKLCKKYKLLDFTEDEVKFTSEETRMFCNGIWFEEHIFSKVYNIKNDKKIFDCAGNVKIISQENQIKNKNADKNTDKNADKHDNELDIVVSSNNRLFIIEAKTANISKNNIVGQNKSDDVIYKLDSLKDKTGGIFTKAMLVSYRTLRDEDKKRAKRYGIEIIAGEELQTLQSRLEKWMS